MAAPDLYDRAPVGIDPISATLRLAAAGMTEAQIRQVLGALS